MDSWYEFGLNFFRDHRSGPAKQMREIVEFGATDGGRLEPSLCATLIPLACCLFSLPYTFFRYDDLLVTYRVPRSFSFDVCSQVALPRLPVMFLYTF